jgi:hypothetical protein
MTMSDTRAVPLAEGTVVGLDWTPVVAGTFAAAALAFVLHGFALAIGLSVSSTAPTWRDASFALVLLSGFYLLLAALASYAFGAYVAARLRARVVAAPVGEIEFRDGMHGLVVWALATLLAGLLALAAVAAVPRLVAPSGAANGAATSVAGENLIAFDLDRLFRGDRRPSGDMTYIRAEAARILLTTSSHNGISADDHGYLVRLVAMTTGLAPADAERRVNEVAGQAKANAHVTARCYSDSCSQPPPWSAPRWHGHLPVRAGIIATVAKRFHGTWNGDVRTRAPDEFVRRRGRDKSHRSTQTRRAGITCWANSSTERVNSADVRSPNANWPTM